MTDREHETEVYTLTDEENVIIGYQATNIFEDEEYYKLCAEMHGGPMTMARQLWYARRHNIKLKDKFKKLLGMI